ncbi:MAG: hypothetical protein WCH43_08630 [Verrucomicrobiota bacterium]
MIHHSVSLFWLLISYLVLPFIASLYAGVVVSRFNRFYNAKDMACRMIFDIDPGVRVGSSMLLQPRLNERLNYPVQILRDSGQLDAHYILLNIAREIEKELSEAETKLAAGATEVLLSKEQWEAEARMMQPSMQAVFTTRPYQF